MVRTWKPSCPITSIFSVKYDIKLLGKVQDKKKKHCEIVIFRLGIKFTREFKALSSETLVELKKIFLATLCSMQDLSSPTKDRACAPCIGSDES